MSIPTATVLLRSGPKPTALLHGMLMSPATWTHAELVQQIGGHIVAYPLPAHPTWEIGTEELRPLLGLTALVDVYAAAIERDFGEVPIDIIGHSTGGFLALLVAAHRPDLVRRLVVISGFADGAMDSRAPLLMRVSCLPVVGTPAFRAGLAAGLASRRLFITAAARSASAKHADLRQSPFREVLDQTRLDLSKCDLRALALFIQWLSSVSLSADLSRVTAPVLLIVGSADPVVPVYHQLNIARQLEHCQSLVLEGVGHLPMMEAEGATTHAIGAWLGPGDCKEALNAYTSASAVSG